MAGFKYQPGGLSGLNQRGRLSGCAVIGCDAYFASNPCRRRSCARRVLFLKKASSTHATLITSQSVPVPYLASASAQMPRCEGRGKNESPDAELARSHASMVLLIRGALKPLKPWGGAWWITRGEVGRGWRKFEVEREPVHRCRVARNGVRPRIQSGGRPYVANGSSPAASKAAWA